MTNYFQVPNHGSYQRSGISICGNHLDRDASVLLDKDRYVDMRRQLYHLEQGMLSVCIPDLHLTRGLSNQTRRRHDTEQGTKGLDLLQHEHRSEKSSGCTFIEFQHWLIKH